METTGLSSFPPVLQYFVLALTGLGIAFGMVKKYFKEQPTPIAVVPALDERTAKDLCESIDRLDRTMRDSSHDTGRLLDSHTRIVDAMKSLERATVALKATPDNQELLLLLRRIAQREGVFSPPLPGAD